MWDGAASEGHRMRHKVFTTLSALSLLLCIATATIWATGWRFPWPVRPLMGRWAYILVVDRGYVFLEFFHFAPTPVVGPPLGPGNTETPAIVAWRKQFGTDVHFERLRLPAWSDAGWRRRRHSQRDEHRGDMVAPNTILGHHHRVGRVTPYRMVHSRAATPPEPSAPTRALSDLRLRSPCHTRPLP